MDGQTHKHNIRTSRQTWGKKHTQKCRYIRTDGRVHIRIEKQTDKQLYTPTHALFDSGSIKPYMGAY